MFKPEKNLKLSLNRHFVLFPRLLSVRFFSQTFANDVPHGYASFKHICSVIFGYVGATWWTSGMKKKHAWRLQEAWITRKRREKRRKWIQTEFLVFPFSVFFLFLSSLSLFHVHIRLYLHKRNSGNRFLVYVCLPKTRNLSYLLTTLQEAISPKF